MKKRKAYKEQTIGMLFIVPLVLYFLIFQLLPMLIALGVSFTEWNLLGTPAFVGFANYINLFTNELKYPDFWQSMVVTVLYILMTVPGSIMLCLIVSAFLNSNIKGESFLKTIFYLPSVTAGAAVAAMWTFMLDPQYGLVNQVLGSNIGFLSNEHLALPSLAVMAIWGGLGYNVLIMLASMKGINPDLYEASSLDGAGPVKQFFHITIPSVKPVIFFLTVTSLIGAFQAFDQMYLMTGGGPNKSTLTYMLSLYRHAVEYNDMGAATAMSYILFFIIATVTFIQFRLVRKRKDVV